MRLALCAEALAHLPFAEQCRFARAVGYEGVELEPQRLSDEPHRLPRAERAELRRIATESGTPVTGLHSILYVPAGLSITAADPATRQLTLDVIARMCELCADLGGTYLVHGSANQRNLSADTPADDRKRGVEALVRGAEVAATFGVDYVIEPIRPARTNFINTIAEAMAIIAESGAPALSTMLDCLSASEAETESAAALAERWLPSGKLTHVHLNDANRRGPGQGDLRFLALLHVLKTHGYNGWISVEPLDFYPDGSAAAARAAGYVQGLLEALETA